MSFASRRHRHGRLHPYSRRRLRHRRPQAGLGRDLRRRRRAAEPSARSRRPARAIGRRCGAAVRRPARVRPAIAIEASAALGAKVRAARRVLSGSPRRRGRVGGARGRRSAAPRRRGASRTVTLPHAGDIAPIYLHLVLADAAAYHAATLERAARARTRPTCASASRWAVTSSPKTTCARSAAVSVLRARSRARAARTSTR